VSKYPWVHIAGIPPPGSTKNTRGEVKVQCGH